MVDLGAGTGILTRVIWSARRHDGDPGRAGSPDAGTVGRGDPGITALPVSAEASRCPTAPSTPCVAGQAYHWFDLDKAHAEIARVIRSGRRVRRRSGTTATSRCHGWPSTPGSSTTRQRRARSPTAGSSGPDFGRRLRPGRTPVFRHSACRRRGRPGRPARVPVLLPDRRRRSGSGSYRRDPQPSPTTSGHTRRADVRAALPRLRAIWPLRARLIAFVDQPQADQGQPGSWWVTVAHSSSTIGARPPVATTALYRAQLVDDRADDAVDLAGEAVHDAGLQALDGVLADDPRRLDQLDLAQLGGPGGQRVDGDLDARGQYPAEELAAGRRPRRSSWRCRSRPRSPGRRTGCTRRACSRPGRRRPPWGCRWRAARRCGCPARRSPWAPSGSTRPSIVRSERSAAGTVEQAAMPVTSTSSAASRPRNSRPSSSAVSRASVLTRQRVHELLALERGEHGVGVADVDAEQHGVEPNLCGTQVERDVEDRRGVGQRRRPRGSRRRSRRTRAPRSRVSPPVASSSARSPTAATTSRSSAGGMLSQSRNVAPASTASTASATVVTSTCTGTSGNASPHPPVRGGDRAGGQLVVVLDHRDVVEAHPLVGAAAGADRVLLQDAQARRGLAGVEHGRLGAGERVRPGAGCGWPPRTSGTAG